MPDLNPLCVTSVFSVSVVITAEEVSPKKALRTPRLHREELRIVTTQRQQKLKTLLQSCHYVFIETSRCLESGAYYESGTETFVGNYDGQPGTFTTNYVFTAKYANCTTFTGETAGRCQHPFVDGSGTGVFLGIKEARIDMKDDVEAGNFPYRGHLSF